MARPKKRRKICSLPNNTEFFPASSGKENDNIVIMSVDEYETIRLIDILEMTQEECAKKMGIARTTVQAIYISARKKLAICLVNGKRLIIEGGDFNLCNGMDLNCMERRCCTKTKDKEV